MTAVVDALVEPEWLLAHLDDADLRIIHVSPDRAQYDAGHVRGALYLSNADLMEERDGIRALVPDPAPMTEALRRVGVGPQHRVVFTAEGRSPWPARGYWALRYYGFPRVHLSNGAVPALRAAGLPITEAPTEPTPLDAVELTDHASALISTAEQVLQVANGGAPGVVLDCRSDEEFEGRGHGAAEAPRAGRVPRAVHVEWTRLVDDEGRFLRLEQLRSLYAAAGITGSEPIYPYCGGGIRSSVAWFVLHELLGYEGAANYDGSWSEWAARSELPIETGPRE